MSRARDSVAVRIAKAAAWHARLTEAEEATTPEFEAWCAVPENAQVWSQALAMWEFLGERAQDPEMVRAREAALADVRRVTARRHRRAIRPRRALAIAASFVFALGAGFAAYRWYTAPADYQTAFGERRVVTLSDGSRISLDSDSEVTVRYSRTARELKLLRGQARFDVAHDVLRPFSVVAGDQKIVATGTAFNIDMTEAKIVIALIEGHIVVIDTKRSQTLLPAAAIGNRQPIKLRAGQELMVAPEIAPVVTPVNVQRVVAWTAGQLMFSNEPLGDVVARVSHYSTTPIRIADPAIARERVTGVFNTGDVAGFLDIVTQALPIEAKSGPDGEIVLRRKS